jgi:hypothetical protein
MTGRYTAEAGRQAALRDAERQRSRVVARWRLATFLPAVGLVLWAVTRDPHPLAAPLDVAAVRDLRPCSWCAMRGSRSGPPGTTRS